ncbi:ANTAR domain-containing protein [Cellulomonas sp. 179-A 4D5 NHS]|uniref:ANTAR domain-containing protein n=1 Tax=Cellulomonas sp. 179-A 4D5 NHS TaxID=3142378 RepID=UPI0039A212F9
MGELCQALDAQTRTSDDLWSALATRPAIDQAIGVIMGQNRCGHDEAMAILRSASSNRNIAVRDIAADIVERLTGHRAAPEAPFTPRH